MNSRFVSHSPAVHNKAMAIGCEKKREFTTILSEIEPAAYSPMAVQKAHKS
jgi:hypothetical protein